MVIYNFRLELVERLLLDGYEVHVSSPYGDRIRELVHLGIVYHPVIINRHGMNLFAECGLLRTYYKLIKNEKPDVVLGYTIKPNIYGALAAACAKVPFVANITGLGTAIENEGIKQKILVMLYRIAFKKVQRVFFQNEDNRKFFLDKHIAIGKDALLPGSGVNLQRFKVMQYPEDTIIRFVFLSRIMKEKGIEQYLEAAEIIKGNVSNVEFHVCGFCEKEYVGRLEELNKNGTVIYHGMIKNVGDFLENMHCVIHPTYYPEGMSNVLLESCACGRPIITTNRAGCREIIEDGINGLLIQEKNSADLVEKIYRFLSFSNNKRKNMGLAGRAKVEREFDRQIVVDAYMREIDKAKRALMKGKI